MELSSFFEKLLISNLILVGFYVLYHLLFSRLTFHRFNRFILLSALLFAFAAPYITIENTIYTPINTNFIWTETFDDFFIPDTANEHVVNTYPTLAIPWWKLIYTTIATLFLFRSMWQIFSILKLRWQNNSKKTTEVRYVEIGSNEVPFSFFKWIFIPKGKKVNEIIEHELVHVNQGHTFDLVLMELVSIVCWFNPFVFLFRRSMKAVHEFLADEYSIERLDSPDRYIQLLMAHSNNRVLNRFSNQFTNVPLKKRIQMMTKNKSNKLKASAYVLLIPAFVAVLLFTSEISLAQTPVMEHNHETEEAEHQHADKDEYQIKEGEYPSPSQTPISPIHQKDLKKISSGYGERVHPIHKTKQFHYGMDMVAEKGKDVLATQKGTVTEIGHKPKSYGHYVLIDHGDGYSTFYTQLSEVKVTKGQKVKQSDVVGLIGMSGMSTGPHLHFEVRYKGERLNPKLYLPN